MPYTLFTNKEKQRGKTLQSAFLHESVSISYRTCRWFKHFWFKAVSKKRLFDEYKNHRQLSSTHDTSTSPESWLTMRSAVFLCLLLFSTGFCKVFERCELARALSNTYKLEQKYLASMVCIAYHESRYNTRVHGAPNKNRSRDNGLFQLNDKYWCTNVGSGHDCNINCAKLRDDDIADDVACMKKILRVQGFTAWSTYKYCKDPSSYLKGC